MYWFLRVYFEVQRTENIYSQYNTSSFKVRSTVILIIHLNKGKIGRCAAP
jgi:hypothetical protein